MKFSRGLSAALEPSVAGLCTGISGVGQETRSSCSNATSSVMGSRHADHSGCFGHVEHTLSEACCTRRTRTMGHYLGV